MTCEQFDLALPAYLAGTISDKDARLLEEHAASCAVCEPRLDAATRLDRQLNSYVAASRAGLFGHAAPMPELPEGLRTATLDAVARRRQQQRTNRWLRTVTAVAAVAAVALLAVAVWEFASRPSAPRGSDTSVATTNPGAPPTTTAPTTTPPATVRPDSNRTDTSGERARPPISGVAVVPPATRPADSAASGVSTTNATAVSRVVVSDPDRFAVERSTTEFAALDAAARELEVALTRSPDDAELRTFLATVHARRDELTRRVKAAKS